MLPSSAPVILTLERTMPVAGPMQRLRQPTAPICGFPGATVPPPGAAAGAASVLAGAASVLVVAVTPSCAAADAAPAPVPDSSSKAARPARLQPRAAFDHRLPIPSDSGLRTPIPGPGCNPRVSWGYAGLGRTDYDNEAADEEMQGCRDAADLLCYQAANVVVILEGEGIEAQRLGVAIEKLAD
ncbi:MAG: hypothetical protein ACRDK5_00445 [Solirubrobacterales bacterium]